MRLNIGSKFLYSREKAGGFRRAEIVEFPVREVISELLDSPERSAEVIRHQAKSSRQGHPRAEVRSPQLVRKLTIKGLCECLVQTVLNRRKAQDREPKRVDVSSIAKNVEDRASHSLTVSRSAHLLDDQHWRLVRIVVADADHSQRPLTAQRDRVARSPTRNCARQRRRLSGCTVCRLQPEQKCHPVPPPCRWGRTA